MTARSYLTTLVLAAAVCAATPAVGLVHPGHGSRVVMGTLIEVSRDAIAVETRDAASAALSKVRVRLSPDTRFRIDKERLQSLDGMIGQRAIVSVDWEDDDRGGQVLTATEVRLPGRRRGSTWSPRSRSPASRAVTRPLSRCQTPAASAFTSVSAAAR